MKKDLLITNKSGFSLVEVLLAVTLFATFIAIFMAALLYGQESSSLAGEKSRALIIAQEGLEAVRNIRDESYTNLIDGTYGLAVTDNQWTFSGTEDQTDVYTRQVIISAPDDITKSITVNVSWTRDGQQFGPVTLTSYLTDWPIATPIPTPPPEEP